LVVVGMAVVSVMVAAPGWRWLLAMVGIKALSKTKAKRLLKKNRPVWGGRFGDQSQ
jgi:hypothetical protein